MTGSEAFSENFQELVAAQSSDRSMPNSFPTPPIELSDDTTKEPIPMSKLLDRLGERKPDFLNGIQQTIHVYIANQGRRVCMSLVETDGLAVDHPRTHILKARSFSTYLDVFQCFIRKKTYHGHALDSGLSEPVAGIIARRYSAMIESCSDDLKQYFLSRLIEDEVMRNSLAVHIATLLAEKAYKHSYHGRSPPAALTYVGYKLNRLPNDFGESIAKGVKKDLDANFGNITEQVLDEMAKDVYDLEKLASAVFDGIITVDGWEKCFEGLDVADPAISALNHEIGRGVGYAKDFRKTTKADETLNVPHESPPAYVADFVCVTCDLNLGPLDDIDQLTHANGCLDQRKTEEDIIVRCWVCYVDLQEMSDVAKNEHLSGCLGRRPPQIY